MGDLRWKLGGFIVGQRAAGVFDWAQGVQQFTNFSRVLLNNFGGAQECAIPVAKRREQREADERAWLQQCARLAGERAAMMEERCARLGTY